MVFRDDRLRGLLTNEPATHQSFQPPISFPV